MQGCKHIVANCLPKVLAPPESMKYAVLGHAGNPKSFKHAHTGPAVHGHSLNSKHSFTNAELPTSFFLASAWCLRVRECSPVLCTDRHATHRLSPLLGRGQRASHSVVFFVVVVHAWTYLHGRHRVPIRYLACCVAYLPNIQDVATLYQCYGAGEKELLI